MSKIFIQATIQNVSAEKYKEISIALPSIDGQKAIIKYIETKIEIIDKAIAAIRKEIDLITEYRTSLISNVVNGKVDVRNIEVKDVLEDLDGDIEDLDEDMIEEEELDVGEED